MRIATYRRPLPHSGRPFADSEHLLGAHTPSLEDVVNVCSFGSTASDQKAIKVDTCYQLLLRYRRKNDIFLDKVIAIDGSDASPRAGDKISVLRLETPHTAILHQRKH